MDSLRKAANSRERCERRADELLHDFSSGRPLSGFGRRGVRTGYGRTAAPPSPRCTGAREGRNSGTVALLRSLASHCSVHPRSPVNKGGASRRHSQNPVHGVRQPIPTRRIAEALMGRSVNGVGTRSSRASSSGALFPVHCAMVTPRHSGPYGLNGCLFRSDVGSQSWRPRAGLLAVRASWPLARAAWCAYTPSLYSHQVCQRLLRYLHGERRGAPRAAASQTCMRRMPPRRRRAKPCARRPLSLCDPRMGRNPQGRGASLCALIRCI